MQERYQALYRQWRPQTFDNIVGQDAVVKTLRQAVISSEIGHAYLFSGTRGTGKTSIAKIFARAVNCLDPQNGNPCNECEICEGILSRNLLDVVEMDAASNNSVEDVRRIIEEVHYLPARAKYKVYIIDEVHMLSTAAFNALLKTLEEPPGHAIFILATTEPQRLPATILSRCQRYDFQRIALPDLQSRLREISDSIELKISDDAIELIAILADGALRDAISLLDQCRVIHVNTGEQIEREDILEMTGRVNDRFMLDLLQALLQGDAISILSKVEEIAQAGQDYRNFANELTESFRNLFILRSAGSQARSLLSIPNNILNDYVNIARHLSLPDIQATLKRLSDLLQELRWTAQPRLALETFLLTLDFVRFSDQVDLPLPTQEPETTPVEEQSTEDPHLPNTENVFAVKNLEDPESETSQEPTLDDLDLVGASVPLKLEANEESASSEFIEHEEITSKPEEVPDEFQDAAVESEDNSLESVAVADEATDEPEEVMDEVIDEPASEESDKEPDATPVEPDGSADFDGSTDFDGSVDAAESHDSDESVNADKPHDSDDIQAVPAEELEARWEEILEAIDQEDGSFLQFSIRHFKRSFDDGLITVYFAPEHRALYNDLNRSNNIRRLDRATEEIFRGRRAGIELRLIDNGEEVRPAKINRDRSAWLAEAKKILEENGIPFEEENTNV